jgi:hypothetical protein
MQPLIKIDWSCLQAAEIQRVLQEPATWPTGTTVIPCKVIASSTQHGHQEVVPTSLAGPDVW